MSYLCFYHNNDGDERGWWRRGRTPELSCQTCRAEAVKWARRGGKRHFTMEEVAEYEDAHPHALQTRNRPSSPAPRTTYQDLFGS